MAWGNCPTHGPIQTARAVHYGGVLRELVCDCGLTCEPFETDGFVEHETLVEEGASALAPEPEVEEDALEALPGGYFGLPNGEKVKGKQAALDALRGLSSASEE